MAEMNLKVSFDGAITHTIDALKDRRIENIKAGYYLAAEEDEWALEELARLIEHEGVDK